MNYRLMAEVDETEALEERETNPDEHQGEMEADRALEDLLASQED